jgi:PIN domain nuclease of toxin-antitoxin system
LALGIEEGLPVLTTDRAWSKLDVGVEVRALR